jgi:hypothetical protein
VPVTFRLLARAGVVEAKPRGELFASLAVGGLDRVEQPSDPGAHQRRGVLDRGGAEHRGRVDHLLRPSLDQAKLASKLERALKPEPLLAVQQAAG